MKDTMPKVYLKMITEQLAIRFSEDINTFVTNYSLTFNFCQIGELLLPDMRILSFICCRDKEGEICILFLSVFSSSLLDLPKAFTIIDTNFTKYSSSAKPRYKQLFAITHPSLLQLSGAAEIIAAKTLPEASKSDILTPNA